MIRFSKIAILLIIPILSFSQSKKVKALLHEIENDWSIDDNGNITYVYVSKAEGLSKDEIFNRVQDYLIYNYSSGKSVIQTEDKEGGRIIGKGLWKEVHIGNSLATTYLDCWHILRVDVKEGRARIMLTLTQYEQKVVTPGYGNTLPSTSYATFKVEQTFPCIPKGRQKTMFGKAFYKSHKSAVSTILSVDKAIKEGNTSKNLETDDNW